MDAPSEMGVCDALGRARAVGEQAAAPLLRRLTWRLGGATRARVILTLACVLALSSADVATVGASASALRHGLGISNTDIGLLVTVTSLVGALASLPFGVLADRFHRTRTLMAAIVLWGGAMAWSAAVSSFSELLLARLFLGVVTAAAGPMIASLVGDYFPGNERGRVWGHILAGELVGAGFGFAVSGDLAVFSWRAFGGGRTGLRWTFVVMVLPLAVAAILLFRALRTYPPDVAAAGAAAEEDARERRAAVGESS